MLPKVRPHGRIKARIRKQPAFLTWVAAKGCAVCGGPAEVHHVRRHSARDDQFIVGLCPAHHRTGPDAYHALGSIDLFREAHEVCLATAAERNRAEGLQKGLIRG